VIFLEDAYAQTRFDGYFTFLLIQTRVVTLVQSSCLYPAFNVLTLRV